MLRHSTMEGWIEQAEARRASQWGSFEPASVQEVSTEAGLLITKLRSALMLNTRSRPVFTVTTEPTS